MRDPFRPNSNKQLVREAQFGFAVIGLLVALLIYVAYYRLNGLGDELPQQIRDAPVALQVFPDSPNYDRTTNQMVARKRPTKKDSPIVAAPKRVMEESSNTFRSMQQAAKKIEGSAAKVHSLASVPINEEPVGLVSNPAARKPGIELPKPARPKSKKPPRDVVTSRAPDRFAKLETPTKIPQRAAANPVQPLLQKMPRITKPESPEAKPVSLLVPTNEFKPLKSKPLATKSLATRPLESKPFTTKPFTTKPFATKPFATKPFATKPFATKPFATKPATRDPIPPVNNISLNPRPSPPGKPTRLNGTPLQPVESVVPTARPKAEMPETQLPSFAKTNVAPAFKQVSFIEQETWTVKQGDSFWSIAQSRYGDGRFFRALYEQNRLSHPDFENLKAGTQLVLPAVEEMRAQHPDLCPSSATEASNAKPTTNSNPDQRLYETRRGDTLFDIARQRLGQASRYVELMELNRNRLENNLTHESTLPVGTQILLPAR